MFSVKWFDKVIAQSSRGQFVAFAVALVAMILAGALVGHFVLDRANADNAAGCWLLKHFQRIKTTLSSASAGRASF